MNSPQLAALGAEIRILAVLIDAVAAYGFYCDEAQARIDTAWLYERQTGEGWNPSRTRQRFEELGVSDIAGVFRAAGLTERQTQVMTIRYSRGRGLTPTPREIAQELGWPSLRVRVHLHEGYDRLRKWAQLVALNDFPIASGDFSTHVTEEAALGNRPTTRYASADDRRAYHLRPMQRGLRQVPGSSIPVPEELEPVVS